MPRIRFRNIHNIIEKSIGRSQIENNYIEENEIIDEQTDYLYKGNNVDNFKYNEYILDIIYNIFSYLQNTIKFMFGVSGIYLIWICLHYFASHMYIKFCVPSTVMGFLLSPFMVSTPHCQALRWLIHNASNMINNMWIVSGTWICSTILKINQ